MYPYSLHTFFLCLFNHRLEMIDMRMDITIRKKTDEVKCALILLDVLNKLLPCSSLEHISRRDGIGYELCSLCENPAASHRVMSYFAVTHISIGRKTDSCTMCLKLCPWR